MLEVVFCEDNTDARAEVDKKMDVVVVEGERNGITMVGLEVTEGNGARVGAMTEEGSIVVVIAAETDAWRSICLPSKPRWEDPISMVSVSTANATVIRINNTRLGHVRRYRMR